jgi:hypothetical protein
MGTAHKKSRVLATIAVLAMAITMSGLAYVDNSWAQAGTAGGAGDGDGGGAGASSGGTGGGGTAPSAGGGGVAEDSRLGGDIEPGMTFASTSPIPFRGPQSSGGLTRAQERTWDAFGQCATRGAMIDQLRVDGSFTFQANSQSDARTTKECMTRIGYRFEY